MLNHFCSRSNFLINLRVIKFNMNKLIGFNIKRNKKLLVSDIIKFYQVRGYELIDADARGMFFKRGNIWGNMTSLKPNKWKTTVDVEIVKKERLDYNIYANYKFTTSGFLRSKIEDSYYDEELNAFANAIENFEVDGNAIELLAHETNKSNFWLILKSLLLGILCATIAIFLINSFLIDRLPIGIAAIFPIVFIFAFYFLLIRIRENS